MTAALALALGAAPASAREVFTIHGDRLGAPYPQPFDEGITAPVLVTGGVAYLDLPGEHAHVMFRPPGGPSRVVQQFEPLLSRPRARHLVGNLELDGDGRRLALGRYDEHPNGFPTSFGAIVTARLGGPARTLFDCPEDSLDPLVQVDGSVVTILEPTRPGCRGPLRYRAHDLSTGAVFAVPSIANNGSDPVVAGRYAIWSDQLYEHGEDIPRSIVYDYRAGRTVHRTRAYDLYAVGRDGTLVGGVFTVPGRPIDDECRDLVTYTVANPTPRPLPYRTCEPYAVSLAGQRIVFLAPPPGRPEDGRRQRLMLGDTSGAPAVPLSESFAAEFGEYDFDGARVAYRLYRCGGARAIAVDAVATALARGPIRLGECSAGLTPPAHAVDIARGFDLGIDCPRGCGGALRVVAGKRHWKLRARKPFPLKPGAHTVHVSARAAKPATGTATRHAVLEFAVAQPDGLSRTYSKPIEIRKPG